MGYSAPQSTENSTGGVSRLHSKEYTRLKRESSMSTATRPTNVYPTIYTKLSEAHIPQAVAEKAAANIVLLEELNPFFDGLHMTTVFIASYKFNPHMALDSLEELLERAEYRAVQS